ncbi:MAG: endonuclease V [Candidatus Methanosuratincola petrocarbonis]
MVSLVPPDEIHSICGMDTSYRGEEGFAAAVVMSFPEMEEIEVETACGAASVPYMPGFLGFREMRLLASLFGRLATRASAYIVNGHGAFHPEGLGAASHFGVAFDVPTIGVCRSPLSFEGGSVEGGRLIAYGKEVGGIIRGPGGGRLFVSAGHRMSPERALEIVRGCMKGHRLPEPLFLADLYSKRSMEGRPVIGR